MSRLIYITHARLPTEKAHGVQICKMSEAFAQQGHDVLLLHPYRQQQHPLLRQQSVFSYYGIPDIFRVHTLRNADIFPFERSIPGPLFPGIFLLHSLLWAHYAASVAGSLCADIYYTRHETIAFWLARRGVPTVYEAHSLPRRGRRWLLRAICRQQEVRLVVALTRFIADEMIRLGCKKQRVVVLPDGVDLAAFAHLPSRETCRTRCELPQRRSIIGYIGRFETMGIEKGIVDLVQMMAHIPGINGQSPLLLCVGGPLDQVGMYQSMAAQAGVPRDRLCFVDHVPHAEVPHWIRACDVVLLPWRWNTFSAYYTSPLKLFEYMAAEVPIVATDLPALNEVLRHQFNAWLVPPGNAISLAEGVRQLLHNRELSARLATQACQDVRNYTWQQRAARIVHALLEQDQ